MLGTPGAAAVAASCWGYAAPGAAGSNAEGCAEQEWHGRARVKGGESTGESGGESTGESRGESRGFSGAEQQGWRQHYASEAAGAVTPAQHEKQKPICLE